MNGDLHQRVLSRVVSLFDAPVMQNNLRGLYVEYMVTELLGEGWHHNGADWAAYDLEHESGFRLEVKQSAARQTWVSPTGARRSASFGIRVPKMEWMGSVPVPRTDRVASLYVFAWHGDRTDAADQRDAKAWEFLVIPTVSLPEQKTISLSVLREMTAAVGAEGLKASVEAMFTEGFVQ